VQRVAQCDIIDPRIPAQRVDPQALRRDATRSMAVAPCRAGATHNSDHSDCHEGLNWQNKAGSGLGQEASFATKLGWTMALPFMMGHGGVIRMHDFALGQLFALGSDVVIAGDMPMRVAGAARSRRKRSRCLSDLLFRSSLASCAQCSMALPGLITVFRSGAPA